jgi:hypothetical protein
MRPNHPPLVLLPGELSDEAAAQLLEFLYELARVLENTYAAQIRRFYQNPDPRQRELWPEQDPPF